MKNENCSTKNEKSNAGWEMQNGKYLPRRGYILVEMTAPRNDLPSRRNVGSGMKS